MDETTKKLRTLAGDVDLFSVDLNDGGRVHNWRNHINYDIKDLWNELTERERLIIYITARYQADMEEWD